MTMIGRRETGEKASEERGGIAVLGQVQLQAHCYIMASGCGWAKTTSPAPSVAGSTLARRRGGPWRPCEWPGHGRNELDACSSVH